jgi:hypothetical protein
VAADISIASAASITFCCRYHCYYCSSAAAATAAAAAAVTSVSSVLLLDILLDNSMILPNYQMIGREGKI